MLEKLGIPFEVILVDDGSTDESPLILRRFAAEDSRIRLIRIAERSGQLAALDAGFHAARYGVVVTMDADLQNDPEDIPALIEALGTFYVACGVRVNRHDNWIRRASSWTATRMRDGSRRPHHRYRLQPQGLPNALPAAAQYVYGHAIAPAHALRLEGRGVTEVPASSSAGRRAVQIRDRQPDVRGPQGLLRRPLDAGSPLTIGRGGDGPWTPTALIGQGSSARDSSSSGSSPSAGSRA